MSAEFTDDMRDRLVRKWRRIGWVTLVGSFASLPSMAIDPMFTVAPAGLFIAALLAHSGADDYAAGTSVPDLASRLEKVEMRSRRAAELADAAHDRIAQIERMGQQGRVVIPDTLNVRLTRDGEQ